MKALKYIFAGLTLSVLSVLAYAQKNPFKDEDPNAPTTILRVLRPVQARERMPDLVLYKRVPKFVVDKNAEPLPCLSTQLQFAFLNRTFGRVLFVQDHITAAGRDGIVIYPHCLKDNETILELTTPGKLRGEIFRERILLKVDDTYENRQEYWYLFEPKTPRRSYLTLSVGSQMFLRSGTQKMQGLLGVNLDYAMAAKTRGSIGADYSVSGPSLSNLSADINFYGVGFSYPWDLRVGVVGKFSKLKMVAPQVGYNNVIMPGLSVAFARAFTKRREIEFKTSFFGAVQNGSFQSLGNGFQSLSELKFTKTLQQQRRMGAVLSYRLQKLTPLQFQTLSLAGFYAF